VDAVEAMPLRDALVEMSNGSCLEVRDVTDLKEFQRRLKGEAQASASTSARRWSANTFE
jgi:hypothetical protein